MEYLILFINKMILKSTKIYFQTLCASLVFLHILTKIDLSENQYLGNDLFIVYKRNIKKNNIKF